MKTLNISLFSFYKKKACVIILLLALGCSEKETKQLTENYILKGNIDGIENNTWIYLAIDDKTIDSSRISENKFEMSGEINQPQVFDLFIKNSQNFTRIWLESNEIAFEAKNGFFQEAEITGSTSQSQSEKLWKPIREYRKRRDSLSQLVYNSEISDSLKAKATIALNQVSENRLKIEKNFIKNNPSSFISAATLDFYSTTFNKSTVTNLYNNLSEDVKNSNYGQSIKRFLDLSSTTNIGDMYTDFKMKNTDGKQVKLSENIKKVTLLEFWGSNCGPCRKENPNLVKTYNKYNTLGFEVFAVSQDTNKASWLKAIEKDSLPWIHVSDLKRSDDASLIYGINGIPDNFLIDKNGIIVGRNLRGQELNKKIDELIGDSK